MKKIFIFIFPLILVISTLTLCSNKSYAPPEPFSDQLLSGLSLQQTYNKIAKLAQPAVVSLKVTTVEKVSLNTFNNFFGNDEFLRRFFGAPKREEREKRGEAFGSGFVISKDGYLISNFHVVKNGTKIVVIFKDSDKEYTAEVVGTDPDSDIALLKLKKGDNFPYVLLGDSEKVNVGDISIAIGNPFGLQSTFTTGVISAKGRTGIAHNQYENFLQTDVAINPGNSGGPLLNIRGEVIGVNSMIYSQSGGNIGIGFAIPINMVKNIVEQLKSSGRVVRGWLGVSIVDITSELAEDLDISKNGVYIPEVVQGSPAERGGVKAGDILLKYDGKKITDQNDLKNKVAETMPGKTVPIELLRKGVLKTVQVTIKDRTLKDELISSEVKSSFGLVVTTIPEELLKQYNRGNQFGVYIESVESSSKFAEKGVRAGDIIRMINYQEVHSIEEYQKIMKKVKSDKKIIFHIQRGSYLMIVVIRP